MVATNGFLTKSKLCERASTYEFLIRRRRLSRAFVSTEPEHSFKNNINNITSLLFLPSLINSLPLSPFNLPFDENIRDIIFYYFSEEEVFLVYPWAYL